MLTQKFTTRLPNGKDVTKEHPVGFASKQTSTAEARYQPYLLEFTALKFSLDHFTDILWGNKIKLHSDCKAL